MRKIAEERGGKCLSIEYVDQRTPLLWECSEGHTWKAKPADIKGNKAKPGTWCKTCGLRTAGKKRMHTIEQMQILAEKKGGSFASPEYLGSQIKHRWRCSLYPSHPEFEMIPNAVQQGQWCPKCSGNAQPTLIELNELAKSRHPSAKCLSQSYINGNELLQWECGVEGHRPFFSSYISVKHNESWCDQCRKEKARNWKYDRKFCVDLAIKLGGKLLSEEPYRTTKQKFQWECADGHKFIRSLDNILHYHSFCPTCTKKSGLREEYIRELFFHMFEKIFDRVRNLPWLRNEQGNGMELDGYNANLLIAFEHNGLQHYEMDGYFIRHEEKFKIRQKDDQQLPRNAGAAKDTEIF